MITLQQYDNGYYVLYVDEKVRIETPYLFETRDEIELIIELRNGKRREIEWHIDHIPEDEEFYEEIKQIKEKINELSL
ncbi:hypothetical protein FMJ45_25600 [Klebsiella michiganensis]|uniref:hypothetical protein n=1 Tax=Klebsiella michiganensis TaxID=1134687 RepID=UPI0018AB4018|nr:hypothetical protein [Klebsiella michiganensis]MBF8474304.1 hypothetical protein [Klebsiella michiganensis]MBZ6604504.1 hypothetical protein [Klebsiella michiganensis]